MSPLLYETDLKRYYQRNFRLFLSATVRAGSAASVFRSQSDLLEIIRSFLKPEREDYDYKVRLDLCDGSEYCRAAALTGCGGWMNHDYKRGGNHNRNVRGVST
jgi:hypothetical protein